MSRKNWFIADVHLGHGNIIKYCKRPFLTPEEKQLLDAEEEFKVSSESVEWMNTTIIDNINEVVGVDDLLWHLGDFCMGKFAEAKKFRDRIHCKTINNIWGNHDHRTIRPIFNEVFDQVMINVDAQNLVLNHYAMRVWQDSHKGSWNLFGHSHCVLPDIPESLQLDVGCDGHDFMPWSMEQIRKFMAKKIPLWQALREKMKPKEKGGMAPRNHF
jgi:calcineurin-like phosphoesterase family protein